MGRFGHRYRRRLKASIGHGVYPECALCRNPITNQEDLTLDHIIEKSKGGSNKLSNLQPAHGRCNRKKSNKKKLKVRVREIYRELDRQATERLHSD